MKSFFQDEEDWGMLHLGGETLGKMRVEVLAMERFGSVESKIVGACRMVLLGHKMLAQVGVEAPGAIDAVYRGDGLATVVKQQRARDKCIKEEVRRADYEGLDIGGMKVD